MPECLYSTTETGRLLGGLHQNDVRTLIKDGKLRAKKLVVRGRSKRPRQYVPGSEIERFIRELPEADVTAEVRRERKRRGPAPLKPLAVVTELADATEYV